MGAAARCLGLVAAAACSGKPGAEGAGRVATKGDDAATGGAAAGDAAAADAASARDAALAGDAARSAGASAGVATGDLQIRVEWPDVPAAARTSPGRTPCHTPRAPSVAPTTTWGIPDALVIVDGAPSPGAATATASVTLADCALTPRNAVGQRLAITSAVDRPAKLVLRNRGALDRLAPGSPIPVMLPIAGHTVATALDIGAIYSLETGDPEPEVAFIAAVPGAFLTDASGHVLVRDLATGAHQVTAWIPPRAGQPARSGRGTATVAAGELAELKIVLTR